MLRRLTISKGKSRRDNTLLTVGFNLRMKNAERSPRSPAWDDTRIVIAIDKEVSSHAGLWCAVASLVRRLKSTVNKVLSLRDLHFDYGQVTKYEFIIQFS